MLPLSKDKAKMFRLEKNLDLDTLYFLKYDEAGLLVEMFTSKRVVYSKARELLAKHDWKVISVIPEESSKIKILTKKKEKY